MTRSGGGLLPLLHHETRRDSSGEIVGASKMYQLEDAVASLDGRLTDDDVRQLEERYEPHTIKM